MKATPQKKRQKAPRTDLLQIRLTPEEKQAFGDAAELAGTSLSTWVRERLRRMARKELEEANQAVAFAKIQIP